MESYTRLKQSQTELTIKRNLPLLTRYADQLTQDLKSLELALQEKAPSFRYLIEKQFMEYRQELELLSKSTLKSDLGGNQEGSECSSVYVSSCDASSTDWALGPRSPNGRIYAPYAIMTVSSP